jgi:hypothetical protein
MGDNYTLSIGLIAPSGWHEVVSHHVIGNLSSLGIVSQKVVPPTALPPEEKDAERLLHEATLAYIERWNAAEEELAAFLKVTIARPLPTVVTTGGVIDVSYLLDVPHGFDWKGVYIDAGFRCIETVTAPVREERAREFMRLSALEGSILENRILEDNFGVASISTAKLLALAPQSLAPLLTLDAGNVDALLPTLDLAENVTADIDNAVHPPDESVDSPSPRLSRVGRIQCSEQSSAQHRARHFQISSDPLPDWTCDADRVSRRHRTPAPTRAKGMEGGSDPRSSQYGGPDGLDDQRPRVHPGNRG